MWHSLSSLFKINNYCCEPFDFKIVVDKENKSLTKYLHYIYY